MTSDRSETQPEAPPPTDPAAAEPPPLARRAFFRSFSRDAANAAIQAAGVATGLQRATGDAIGAALGITGGTDAVDPVVEAVPLPGPEGPEPILAPPDPDTWFPGRPYRVEDGSLWIVDRSADPRSADEIRCASMGDVAAVMRGRRVFGAPLLAELTAFALWLALIGNRGATVQAKRTRIRTSGAVLRGARANVATIDRAVGRMVAAWDAAIAVTEDETALEEAMLAAATETAARMRSSVAAAGNVGADAMPAGAGPTFGLLTLGSSGYSTDADGGGATAIAAALMGRGRSVRAWVLETRPVEQEARATAWGLAVAGAETSVMADATAGWLLATKRIDAVIVGADRVALDGAVTSVVGTSALAAIARRHGVPCYALATRSTIDREVRDPADPGVEAEPSVTVDPHDPRTATLALRPGTRGPLQDVTPPDLLSAIVTETGVLRPPFDESIARILATEADART